jgi:hypothetical protein
VAEGDNTDFWICNGVKRATRYKILHAGNISSYALTSLPSHTHDDRYYTESEINTKLSGKSDTGHTHSYYSNTGGDMSGDNRWIGSTMGGGTDYWRIGGYGSGDSGECSIIIGDNYNDTFSVKIIDYAGTTYTPLKCTYTGVYGSAFYQESDERLKTFYDPIKVDLEKLKTLRKNYFKFNDKDKLEIGVSAQEIQSLYPEIVSENGDGYLSVAYDKLSVIALAALDEQQKEIDDLKDQLSTIKNILKEKGIL